MQYKILNKSCLQGILNKIWWMIIFLCKSTDSITRLMGTTLCFDQKKVYRIFFPMFFKNYIYFNMEFNFNIQGCCLLKLLKMMKSECGLNGARKRGGEWARLISEKIWLKNVKTRKIFFTTSKRINICCFLKTKLLF